MNLFTKHRFPIYWCLGLKASCYLLWAVLFGHGFSKICSRRLLLPPALGNKVKKAYGDGLKSMTLGKI
jgi:hypothetical protein